jgi:hypothetical protein
MSAAESLWSSFDVLVLKGIPALYLRTATYLAAACFLTNACKGTLVAP